MTRPATVRAEADQHLDDHEQAGKAADQSEQAVPIAHAACRQYAGPGGVTRASAKERHQPPSQTHRAVSKKALHTRVALRSVRLTWLTAVPRSSRSVPPSHTEPVIDR
jgi:hypothetical protein